MSKKQSAIDDITVQTSNQVNLHNKHGVTASYDSFSGNDTFHAGINLPNGKRVTFFVNRDTGLVVVDIINKSGKSGNEIVRINANNVTC